MRRHGPEQRTTVSNPSNAAMPRALTLGEVLEEEYEHLRGQCPPKLDTTDNDCECEPAEEASRLAGLYAQIHDDKGTPPLSALCLSGGGIRSASFSLGVIQGLAKRGLLSKFDYLSTVSGGGYIGGWLTAWIHRHPCGVEGVSKELADGAATHGATCAVEPEPVAHLREFVNYLAPRLGLLSLDMWTLAATYLRNLLLNWLVLLPLLAGLLLLPRLYVAALYLHLDDPKEHGTVSAIGMVNGLLWVIGTVVAVLCLPSLDIFGSERQAAAARRRRPGLAGIAWMILIPITVAGAVSSLRWRWDPTLGPVTDLLLRVGAFYAVAGAVASVVAWRRSPNPSLLRLWYLLLGSFGTAVASSYGVRMVIKAIADSEGIEPAAWVAQHIGQIACFGVPIHLGIFLLMLTLFAGLTSRDVGPGADDDREWWGRLMGAVLRIAVAWLVLMVLALYGPRVVYVLRTQTEWGALAAVVSAAAGIVGMLGGFSASSGERHGTQDLTWKQRLAGALPSIASKVFVVAVLITLSALVNWAVCRLGQIPLAEEHGQRTYLASKLDVRQLDPIFGGEVEQKYKDRFPQLTAKSAKTLPQTAREPAIERPDLLLAASAALAFGMLGYVLLVGRVMGLNRLSLHAIYRSRLARTFLGASHSDRNPEPFTGFDRQDNVPMHHLRRLGLFHADDLVDPRPADGADAERRVPLPAPSCDRVRSLVALWRADSQPLGRYIRDQLPSDERTAGLVKLMTEEPPADADWGGEIRDQVVAHLNNLVCDPRLAEHSAFAGWLRHSLPNGASGLDTPVKREIYHACRQLRADGCPRLLNRLILEEVCVYKGRALLAPAARFPKPLHVVNLALNLVKGRKLAWQQRKAGSFTVSPLHCGFVPQPERGSDGRPMVRGGYRPAVRYGDGISLATAMAISGAAASPNMGYHSSPSVAFLMTLFNARLGWWLGNPAERSSTNAWGHFMRWIAAFPGGAKDGCGGLTWRLAYPRHHLRPLIDEALARTSDDNEYVYLSDGGHFENLGLYEMVRRRCRVIVVSDATADARTSFDDLGNAVRKIRTDLGIPIQIDNVRFFPGVDKKDGKYCAVGMIDYRAVDGPSAKQGTLIYLKAAMRENAPVDVYNYAKTSKKFPHESTVDQFFGESQFESYRRLGEECIDFLCAGEERRWSWEDHNTEGSRDARKVISMDTFVQRARDHVKMPADGGGSPKPPRRPRGAVHPGTGAGGTVVGGTRADGEEALQIKATVDVKEAIKASIEAKNPSQ
jgi:hypothetical protein